MSTAPTKELQTHDEMIAAPAFGEGDDPTVLTPFRDRIADRGGRQLLDYWRALVSAHGLAIKELFDPVEVPSLLPSLYLEEWDDASGQSRIRLTGEVVRTIWGGNVVGCRVDDQVQGEMNRLWKECDRLNFLEQRATLAVYHLEHRDRDYKWIRDLALPMTDVRGERFILGYIWDDAAPLA